MHPHLILIEENRQLDVRIFFDRNIANARSSYCSLCRKILGLKMASLEEPDKGRAWVVAFAASIINLILSGLARMTGIQYVAILETYNVTREEATLPFTLRAGIRCLSGPLVGIAGYRYGVRTVTFWGGVLAAVGAALCRIAPNVTWIAVFWGGIHGCGFAFANTLVQVTVNQYFEKYRATASGIALSGAAVGSLVFPFMLEAILFTYGLHGGFLILAGIIMHVLPPSIILTSPQWVLYPEAYARLWELQQCEKSIDTVPSVAIEDATTPSEKKLESEIRMERTISMGNNPIEIMALMKTSRQCSYEGELGVLRDSDSLSSDRIGTHPNVISLLYRMKGSPDIENRRETVQNGNGASKDVENRYSTSSRMSDQKSADVEKMSDENPAKDVYKENHPKSISQSLMIIARLYTNPLYILISIGMSTYIFIYIPILTVIVDYSTDKGIPIWSGKYLINAMALGDLAGRLCFGWVTDRKYMTLSSFMALLLFLQGLFIALFPFCTSLSSLMILLIFYGMASGSIFVLFPVLVLQYMDTSEQSVGIACVGFLSGIVSFAMTPMIGHFRDEVGSYDGMFYLTGAISVMSGGLWLLEPFVQKWYSKTTGTKTDQREAEADQEAESSKKELVNGNHVKPNPGFCPLIEATIPSKMLKTV